MQILGSLFCVSLYILICYIYVYVLSFLLSLGIDFPAWVVLFGFIPLSVLFMNKALFCILCFIFFLVCAPPFPVADFCSFSTPWEVSYNTAFEQSENALYSVHFPWGGCPPLLFRFQIRLYGFAGGSSDRLLSPVGKRGCHIVYISQGLGEGFSILQE